MALTMLASSADTANDNKLRSFGDGRGPSAKTPTDDCGRTEE